MPTEIADLLDAIGWYPPELADRLEKPASTVYRWQTNRNTKGNPAPTPLPVLDYLRKVKKALDAIPVPKLDADKPPAEVKKPAKRGRPRKLAA